MFDNSEADDKTSDKEEKIDLENPAGTKTGFNPSN